MEQLLRQTVMMVEKAAMPFLDGEDFQAFTNSLRKPCGDHLAQKGLYDPKTDAIFPAQVFHNRIMVEVDHMGPGNGAPLEPAVYELKFKRDASGVFTFTGEPTEMVRRIQYVPKVQSQNTQKSLWNGVL